MTTAASNDDDGDDDYDAGEEVEEKKGKLLSLQALHYRYLLLDNEVNAPPAASHAVVDHHPRSVDGSTASRDETAQAVGMYDYEDRDDHDIDNNHDNDDLHSIVLQIALRL